MSKQCSEKISSYLRDFLKLLTKPQRKYFLTYLIGLIAMVKFRSIREIAAQFGKNNTQGLHHFIKNAGRDKLLEEENQRQVASRVNPAESMLILDDTPCPRNGKHIEGIGFHHSTQGIVKGLCAVTAIVKSGSKTFFWAIRGYRSKKTCPQGEFKSKVELAVEILREAFEFFPTGMSVVMDAWYACASVLNPIYEAGWTFLCAVKPNRFFMAYGKKVSARHLAKGPLKFKAVRLSKKKRFRVAKQKLYLPLVGPVLLFITKGREEIRFFITNNLEMSESEMVTLYTQRFTIELFHKDIKQHLGFKEMFMRSFTGVQTHWTLLGIAYNTISLWNNSQSRSFRKMTQHFRDSVSHPSIFEMAQI